MDKGTCWANRGGIARIMGVSVATISSWKKRYDDFPQPVGRFYNVDKIKEWRTTRDDIKPDTD